MNIWDWLLLLIVFYAGWRLGRNRAMGQLTKVAEMINDEDDTRPEHRLGMTEASLRYLQVVKKL